MVILTLLKLTECGGRPGVLSLVMEDIVLELIQTETGTSIGEVDFVNLGLRITSCLLETGVGHNPCDETWPGEAAFSEPEMQNIRDFVKSLDPVPVLSHCFHSYSQLWLWPYGYDYGAYPDNWQELEQLAIDASDALYSVHGTVFDPINSADLCK